MSDTATLRFDHLAVSVHDAQSAYELFATTLGLPLIEAHTGDDSDGAPAVACRRGRTGYRERVDLPARPYAATVTRPLRLRLRPA